MSGFYLLVMERTLVDPRCTEEDTGVVPDRLDFGYLEEALGRVSWDGYVDINGVDRWVSFYCSLEPHYEMIFLSIEDAGLFGFEVELSDETGASGTWFYLGPFPCSLKGTFALQVEAERP